LVVRPYPLEAAAALVVAQDLAALSVTLKADKLLSSLGATSAGSTTGKGVPVLVTDTDTDFKGKGEGGGRRRQHRGHQNDGILPQEHHHQPHCDYYTVPITLP